LKLDRKDIDYIITNLPKEKIEQVVIKEKKQDIIQAH